MHRRFVILALITAVVLAGTTACPRGTLACELSVQARHHCCGSTTTLRLSDCCGGGKTTSTPAMTAAGVAGYQHSAHLLVTSAVHAGAVACAAAAPSGCPVTNGGPAPPDSPVITHTLLLL